MICKFLWNWNGIGIKLSMVLPVGTKHLKNCPQFSIYYFIWFCVTNKTICRIRMTISRDMTLLLFCLFSHYSSLVINKFSAFSQKVQWSDLFSYLSEDFSLFYLWWKVMMNFFYLNSRYLCNWHPFSCRKILLQMKYPHKEHRKYFF